MIAIVPVRSNSKRIKDKNIKNFNGKPLLFWTLNELEKSKIEKIVVSTDSYRYLNIIKKFNFKKVLLHKRSMKNSCDKSSSESVLLEIISKLQIVDDIFFCQVTTPFLNKKTINEAIDFYKNYDSVLSVVKQNRFLWDNYGKPINYDYNERKRSQDFSSYFVENGSFYISSSKGIQKNKCRLNGKIGMYQMDNLSYFEIDEIDDWEICESLHKVFLNKKHEN